MTEDIDRDRLNDLAREGDSETVAGDVQVGTGTAPGRPPASGTGERSHSTAAPPTGRFDDERAAWGGSDDLPGSAAQGAPPHNEGGALGSRPTDAVADFPDDDTGASPGVLDERQP